MELKVRAVYTTRAEEAVKEFYSRVRKDFREATQSRPELVIKQIYPSALWSKEDVILELDLNDGTSQDDKA